MLYRAFIGKLANHKQINYLFVARKTGKGRFRRQKKKEIQWPDDATGLWHVPLSCNSPDSVLMDWISIMKVPRMTKEEEEGDETAKLKPWVESWKEM